MQRYSKHLLENERRLGELRRMQRDEAAKKTVRARPAEEGEEEESEEEAATDAPLKDYDGESEDAPVRKGSKKKKAAKRADVSHLFPANATPEQIQAITLAAARNVKPDARHAAHALVREFSNPTSLSALQAAMVQAARASK